MEYCKRCVYPANARPVIHIDEEGVCSGCRAHEGRREVDWAERERLFRALLAEYQAKQRAKGSPYDCIVPVSGGKDSLFQTWAVKKRFGLNPLCVTYNHGFNTPVGIRNLTNLVEQLDVNLVRYTTPPGTAVRLAKYMLHRCGDVTWHHHAGIMTWPMQAAVPRGTRQFLPHVSQIPNIRAANCWLNDWLPLLRLKPLRHRQTVL